MAWPNSSDYFEAVQNPQLCFLDDELRQGQPARDAQELPILYSGNFASVFQIHCPTSKKTYAVKCFIRRSARRQERYRHISEHLQQAALPFTVPFTYVEKGIRIGGECYPIVTMEWVEGQPINEFVQAHVDQPRRIERLCEMWVKVSQRLRDARITHADLQHGNVLLVPGADENRLSLKLVDYDGMFLPAVAEIPSGELGHRHFQHPQRAPQKLYSADVDRFSHLVIYTALRALAIGGRGCWQRYDTGENLLFCADDFKNPSRSKLLQELWRHESADLRALAGHLTLAMAQPLDRIPLLDEVVQHGAVLALTPEQARDVDKALASAAAEPKVPSAPAAARPVAAPASAGTADWPKAADFRNAALEPKSAFADADLRECAAVTDAQGLAHIEAGACGVVLALRSGNGRRWAVKCFTGPVADRQERYSKVEAHLRDCNLSCTVGFDYLDKGICVKGKWYPALKMPWVEGSKLHAFVAACVDQPAVLRVLRSQWLRLARSLREAEVTHRDLQHANVLVTPGESVWQTKWMLVDYDDMLVPDLAGLPAAEWGHPAFQHPQRAASDYHGPALDHFSHLVIYTALQAVLSRGPSLWQRYNRGDNLLFCKEDFSAPRESKLLRELWQEGPEELRFLAGRLALATEQALPDVPSLDQVLDGTAVRPLTPDQIRAVARILNFTRQGPGASLPAVPVVQPPQQARNLNATILAPVQAIPAPAAQPGAVPQTSAAAAAAPAAAAAAGPALHAIRQALSRRPALVLAVAGGAALCLSLFCFLALLAAVVVAVGPWGGKAGGPGALAAEQEPAKDTGAKGSALAKQDSLHPKKDATSAKNDKVPPKNGDAANPVKNADKGPAGATDKDKATTPLGADDDGLIQQMKFVRVPQGTFWMGGGSVEGPPTKQVTIAGDFQLAAYTVTQGQWMAVMGSDNNPSHFSRKGAGSASVANIADDELRRFPVENVSFNDVEKFLEKLNDREQGKGWRYRLPREAEWEYACRGAATTRDACSFDFYFAYPSNALAPNMANFNSEFPLGSAAKAAPLNRTREVGYYAANRLALCDMHGNVWQWCDDLYDQTAARVIRGGSWNSGGLSCRAAGRFRSAPSNRSSDLGFRLARVPAEAPGGPQLVATKPAVALIARLQGKLETDPRRAGVPVVAVDLARTEATDADVGAIVACRELRSLDLSGTKVTDLAMLHLAKLGELRTLNLRDTQVSDRGIAELVVLKQLQELDLYGTRVTRTGVQLLRTALPKCRIYAEP